eukprot:sb/3467378/
MIYPSSLMARFFTLCLVAILSGLVETAHASSRTLNQHKMDFFTATFLRKYFCTGDTGWSDKIIGDPAVKLLAEVNIQKFCLEKENIDFNLLKTLNSFALARKSMTRTCGQEILLKPLINGFTKDPLPLVNLAQELFCGQISKPDKCYGALVWDAMRNNIMIKAAASKNNMIKTAPDGGRQQPTETSKQPIRTRYLGHVTGYKPIKDQYFQIGSVPGGRSKRQFSADTMTEFLMELYRPGDKLVEVDLVLSVTCIFLVLRSITSFPLAPPNHVQSDPELVASSGEKVFSSKLGCPLNRGQ